MNLPYVYQLLSAADTQRHGFIKLRGREAEHEVRLMAKAGLVEATFDDGKKGSFTSIKHVLPAGETFLRAFAQHVVPLPQPGHFISPPRVAPRRPERREQKYEQSKVGAQVDKIRAQIRLHGECRVGCEELIFLCTDVVSVWKQLFEITQIAQWEHWAYEYFPDGTVRFSDL